MTRLHRDGQPGGGSCHLRSPYSVAGLSGNYTYVYDARGRQTSFTLTVGSTSYPVTNMTYNDAGQLLTQTYPDGDVVTNTYGGSGWLSGVSTQAGSVISNIGYSGNGGATGQMTTGTVLGIYTLADTYDALARATEIKVTKNSDGSTQFDQVRTFDASGNVSTANTTLAAGTDNQAFCYDEQNRLTAAASSGTVPCQSSSAGTLTAANYNQSFGYDNMGRLSSGPLGTYTYGDSANVHAATAIGGSSYTAAYDAAGNMSCRAPSSSTTCSGTQTGAQLAYNNEGQLSNWQNQPSGPTSTAAFLYDGQGNRVAQQTSSGGSTTTTVYIGNLEEDSGTTTKTSYYYANGTRIAMAVTGTLYAIVTDGLGSTNLLLDTSGNVSAAALYAPYGKCGTTRVTPR